MDFIRRSVQLLNCSKKGKSGHDLLVTAKPGTHNFFPPKFPLEETKHTFLIVTQDTFTIT